MTQLERLARWVRAFDAAAVPPAVMEKAKLHLLDSLTCAFAGRDEPAAVGVIKMVQALGGTPECTIIGTSARTSVVNSVLANGILVRCLDLNDLDSSSGFAGHPSDNIVVALGVGERLGSTGRDLLASIVLGYEMYCRMPKIHLGEAWHRSATSGIVSAAMAGWLTGMPEDKLLSAMALAIPYCNTLRVSGEGSQLAAPKNISNAMVAHTAVTAALLAEQGLTGPPTALDAWSRTLMDGVDLSVLTQPPEYRIMKVGFKAHPSMGTTQAAVQAALEAYPAVKGRQAEIEGISIHVADTPFTRRQIGETARGNPRTREMADHSFAFLVAVALLDGELTLRQFANHRWTEPTVRSMMHKVSLEADPELNNYLPGFPCSIRIITRSGEHTATVPYAPGDSRNPFDFQQTAGKFSRFTSDRIPRDQQAAILEAVQGLEKAASVRELTSVLAVE